MTDSYLLLTPILLLAIISLLGFVGCQLVFPLNPHGAVSHVRTRVKQGPIGSDSISADLDLEGDELIVVTVQWPSISAQSPEPVLSGADYTEVAGPFFFGILRVKVFQARNPKNNTAFTVQADLPGGSATPWTLCVSAYKDVDQNAPVYSPVHTGSTEGGTFFIGTNPEAPPINVTEGDLVYAVAFATDGDGTFPGTNSFTPGPGFTAEFPDIADPIVEHGNSGNPIIAQATNSTQLPSPRGFIFAMGIKAGVSE